MSYNQGTIVWLDMRFTDYSGDKERPVLIISNSALKYVNEVIALKITRTVRADGFSYEIKDEMLSEPLPEFCCIRFNVLETLATSIFSSRKKPVNMKKKYVDEVIEKVKDLIELEM